MSEPTANELLQRTYPSAAFYETKPNYGPAILISLVMIAIVILIIVLLILIFSRIKKPCTVAPPPPSNVRAGFINVSSFLVEWSPSPSTDSYTVYVGATSRFNRADAVNVTVTVSTKTNATVTGLAFNQTYYIVVTATNSCGQSIGSPEITFHYVSVG